MHARRLPALGLSACVLGLALSPVPFIAVGALSHFAPLFTVVTGTPLALGCAFLLWRYLGRPAGPSARPRALAVVEALSWTAVAAFLLLVSRFNLAGSFERLGAVCTAFLVASVACLPVVAARRAALERRLEALPGRVALALLVATVAASSAVVALYLRSPPPPPI